MNLDDLLKNGAVIIINNLTVNNITDAQGDVYTGPVQQRAPRREREPHRALPGSGVGWEVCARLDESLKGHTLDWRMADIERARREYREAEK